MIMRDRPTILIPGSLPNEAVVRIADHFEVVRVDSTDPRLITEELAHRIRGIGCGAQVTSQFIDALPNLEIIASLGVGYDGIDVEHASRKGVTVTNTPDVLSEEVADTAIGLLINVVRELPKAEAWLRDRRWQKQGPYPPTSRTLRGRSVGIFGLEQIRFRRAHTRYS
jgi:lactate dehydrogenase-like 2-hydroxyacid dehydrogenase